MDAGTMYANAKALHELLQEERAKNAKLRDEFRKMDEWHSKELLAAIDENKKLRELVARMARVLKADDEWRDPFYCNPYCADQFRCRSDDCVEVLCPIVEAMRELGVEP